MGDQILEGIIAKADEATDRGLQTQLTMTLHYVDESGKYCI